MRPFTIPDYFSLYRIVSAPVVVLMLVFNHYGWFTALIILSLFTDAADGYIARRWKMQTKRGALLDSVGDLITHFLMIAGLFRFQQEFVRTYDIVIIAIFGLYFIQLGLALFKYRKATSFHTYSSKVAFVFLGSFYILLFVWKNLPVLFYTSVVLTVLSIAEDIALTIFLPKPREDVRGLYWVMKER